MSRSNISDLVHEKIDLLNELQTRIVVLRALDQQRVGSNFTEANDNLRQCLAYWSRLAKQNIRYSNASIDETMDVVHEIFGKESFFIPSSAISSATFSFLINTCSGTR